MRLVEKVQPLKRAWMIELSKSSRLTAPSKSTYHIFLMPCHNVFMKSKTETLKAIVLTAINAYTVTLALVCAYLYDAKMY